MSTAMSLLAGLTGRADKSAAGDTEQARLAANDAHRHTHEMDLGRNRDQGSAPEVATRCRDAGPQPSAVLVGCRKESAVDGPLLGHESTELPHRPSARKLLDDIDQVLPSRDAQRSTRLYQRV